MQNLLKNNFLMFTLLFVLMLLNPVEAQSLNQEKPKVSNDSWISNGEELGKKWWIKNALKYTPLPRPLLYHFEGSYAYSKLDGNLEMESHKFKAALTLRKNIFTSDTKYDLNKNHIKIVLKEKSTEVDDSIFRQKFRVDVTDWLSTAVGMIWERSETKYLESRLTYYGGLRLGIIESEKIDLSLLSLYAFEDTEYMSSEIQDVKKYKDFLSVEDYDSDGLYFIERFEWDINEIITFSQGGNYKILFEDSKFYNWHLNFTLNFKFTKTTSFFTSYQISYDHNFFSAALNDYLDRKRNAVDNPDNIKKIGDVEEKDTAIIVGVKFKF